MAMGISRSPAGETDRFGIPPKGIVNMSTTDADTGSASRNGIAASPVPESAVTVRR